MAAPAVTKNLQALGNYRIAQLLGFNGVLATFKAFDAESQLPAALVAVHQSSVKDARVWEACRQEFEPLTNQPASRLCQPFACGADAGHLWAAYEWQVGSHLGVVVRDNGLPSPSQAFFWMSELADALATLHRRGVVHRIISPASVFVNDFYQVKLLHSAWGRVVLASEGGVLNPVLSCILPFLSPEIAGGSNGDESSDVYSIGAVLYFLLSGMPPFWHDEPSELVEAIKTQPPDFNGLLDLVGQTGYDLLDEMLQKAPEDRPLNLPALSDRLRSVGAALQQSDHPQGGDAQAGATQLEVPAGAVNYEQPPAPQRQAPAPAPAPEQHASQPGLAPPPDLYTRPHVPTRAPEEEAAPAAKPQALQQAQAVAEKLNAQIKDKVKLTRKQMIMIGAGVGALVLALIAVTIIAKFTIGGGKEEDEPADVPETPVVSPKDAKPAAPKLSPEDLAARDATRDSLRAVGQYMRGYHKLNGEWPKTVDDLKIPELGAKDSDFVDAWKRKMELSEAFILSAGKDGKWETTDDLWFDAEKSELGDNETTPPK